MRRYKDSQSEEGIILRLTPFRERDMMVSLLSQHSGKESLLWRSARNKQDGSLPLDLGDIARFEVSRAVSGPAILSKIISIQSPHSARTNFDSMALLSLLIEICDQTIPEHLPDSTEIFELLSLGIRGLGETTDLKQSLRVVTLTLGSLGKILGCINFQELGEPSAKSLLQILVSFEQFIGKKLLTRSSVEEVLRGLKANN